MHFIVLLVVAIVDISNANKELFQSLLNNYNDSEYFSVVYMSCNLNDMFFVSNISTDNFFHSVLITNDVINVPYYPTLTNKLVYIANGNCSKFPSILLDANQRDLFASPLKWIIFNAKFEDFKKVNCLVDSDLTLIQHSSENETKLTKVYKFRQGEELIVEDFGRFRNHTFIKTPSFIEITANRRRNLFEMYLRVCLVITHNSTYQHLLDKREKHLDSIAKVNYVFILHLGDFLNATMNFSVEPTWGYMDNKSNWNGMIGQLTTHRADIGGTPLFVTANRVPIIDYIAMTTPTKSKFVFRQPKLSFITNVFTLPFHISVWIASIILVIITALGLYLGIKWEWYKKRNVRNYEVIDHESDVELNDSIVDVMFLAFGAICQQGASAVPFTLNNRMIVLLLFTSLMFLYTSYSANIVALLQSSSTSIQTLDDLLKSRLQVGVDDTVFNRFYFPNASEPVRRALYLQKVAPAGQTPHYYQIDVGVKMMRKGLFAFHVETGAGYKIVGETFLEDEKCDLSEIQFLQVPDPWLAVQKNSSFKEMLKIGLRKIHESGIQEREVSLLYTKKPTCLSRGSSFIGVGIVDCYPAALVYACGMAIAFIIFLLELIYNQYIN
ncbi:PREDICTED: glutamate receptor U1-like [Nicrophorus vespilloides]|uniref:Glutamate receptor U1-like n=1 Tax=Nicrophorus vespilloides TaxID=110193 RepID=A0ABM1M8H0_NICVS|nr:PREDICTED: glutamate receptor U1-like [Nicrophorus vespilloides]